MTQRARDVRAAGENGAGLLLSSSSGGTRLCSCASPRPWPSRGRPPLHWMLHRSRRFGELIAVQWGSRRQSTMLDDFFLLINVVRRRHRYRGIVDYVLTDIYRREPQLVATITSFHSCTTGRPGGLDRDSAAALASALVRPLQRLSMIPALATKSEAAARQLH